MKKLVIAVLALLVLSFGGLFALSKLAPIDRIKQEAVTQVKTATGRDLAFSDAKIIFWPNIGVSLKNVSFSNADWSSDKQMIGLENLDVQLAVMPLLQKRVEIKKFILDRPVIRLERAADGRANWEFSAAEKKEHAAKGAASEGGLPQGMAFSLGEFQINKGQVSYVDRQSGQDITLSDIDVKIDFPTLESALKLDGGFVYRAERLTVSLGLEKPMDLVLGKTSPGHLKLSSSALDTSVAGVFSTSGTLVTGADIRADIASLSRLISWLGEAKAEKLPFEKISFAAKADAAAESLSLSGATLKMDEVEAKGDVKISFAGKPAIHARLSLNQLNLDRFTGGADTSGGDSAAKSSDQSSEWDATPIDFSGLKAVDADLVLDTQGFSVKGVDVGPSKLTVLLKDGNLKASSSDATLFDGRFSSDLSLNSAPSVPTMAFRFKMDDVQAKPVLKTFAGFEKLSGATDASIDVTSTGNSQKTIVGNLNGGGNVVFRNGSLSGIDLVNIAQMVQKRLDNFGVGEGKTDFVELGGTFKITSGVAHNDDLHMKGPLLQLTGAGDIDLPKKYLKYRVTPVLTASSAVENAGGISVPVDITGPFAAIKIRPDFASVIKNALENPEQIKETVKGFKDQGKALEQDLKAIKKDPAQAIGNLLGGGSLFGNKQPAPAAAVPADVAPVAQAAPEAPTAPVVAPEPAPETPAPAVVAPAPVAPVAPVAPAAPPAPATATEEPAPEESAEPAPVTE